MAKPGTAAQFAKAKVAAVQIGKVRAAFDPKWKDVVTKLRAAIKAKQNDKIDLYLAALDTTARELINKVITSVAKHRTPRERAMAGVEAYLDHVQSTGVAFVSLMRGGIGADASVAGALERVRTDLLDEFLGGNPIGAFLQTRPLSRLAIRSWIGMVEAASIEWLSSPGMAKEPVRDLLVDLLFDLLSRVLGSEVSQTQLVGPVPDRSVRAKKKQ